MTNDFIDGKILFAKNAVDNTINIAPISAAMAVFNYGPEKMGEGRVLVTRAAELNDRQKKEYGDQYNATSATRLDKADCHKVYLDHVELARVVFRNNKGAWQALQLTGHRKKSLSGWLAQVNAFYTNALGTPEYLNGLSVLNITAEALENGLAKAQKVEASFQKQLKETGEAQQATKDRDAAFDAMEDWMGDFKVVARIALKDQPQFLEILGLKEPS
jgi:hypothetical protein